MDELLYREQRNLARRWWGTFGAAYGITVFLIFIGWWSNGFAILGREEVRQFVLNILAIPVIACAVGFLVWLVWLVRRPMRHVAYTHAGRVGSNFKVALGAIYECGWTPWEIDYDHQVIVALSPTDMYDGIPPQVVTVFCSHVSERTTEIRVQSRFIEATRARDIRRIHARNVAMFQKRFRDLASRAMDPDLPMPHPLARLKGKLPEEQLLAFQDLGATRARDRLWAIWVLLFVLAAVLIFLQPWWNSWIAWPLSFIAAGSFLFLLSNLWSAQEHHALTHATASVIANPFESRESLWQRVDLLARAQRWHLHEELDPDTRLYRESQPAGGYPGTYMLFHTIRNDAGIEQMLAVTIPEWGLLTALMPTVYAPFQLLVTMQALRRGPEVKEAAPQRSEPRLATAL